MKRIKNPLTIIGLFAGIAEVAGTAVLPLVSLELQKFFVWYVMGFPVLLVVLFFIMDFSLLTTSGVSQKRNGAVGNTKPPAMRVEDKLLYKKITFPL